MTKKLSFFLFFGLLITLGASCNTSSVTPTVTATSGSSINWWTLWLDKPACQAPCWQNITPGMTTMEEALSIFENTPEIAVTHKSEDGIDFVFDPTKPDSGTISASQNGVVYVIHLGNSYDKNLYLEIVVDSYGFPNYVKPYDCREGMCSTALIYPNIGLLLTVFIEDKGEVNNPRIEIVPGTIVTGVYFFEPGLEHFKKLLVFQENDLLMEWKGYGVYP